MSSQFGERLKRAVEDAEERRPWTPRRAAYVAYMQSDAWRRRRAERLVMNIMEYGVLWCEHGEHMIRPEVDGTPECHHLSYLHWTEERPQDLQIVCHACHPAADEDRVNRDGWTLRLKLRVDPDQLQLFQP